MSRKPIVKALRDVGVKFFDAPAVTLLADYMLSEGGEDTLHDIVQVWKSDGFQGDRLSVESVQSVLAELRGGRQALELCCVINAFDVPKISYDPVGRKLYADTKKKAIFAPALAKQHLYLDRLHLINQRMRRSSLFQPRCLASGGDISTPQLKDIQSLKGRVGAHSFVIGCISSSAEGRLLLEDGSGAIPLNLTDVQTAAGFFTENCIVIAEGAMQVDGSFHATALGFPPCEPRENLPMAAQRLNFFGGPALSSEDTANLVGEEIEHDSDRVVVLSDVHLDRKEVLDALNILFSGYNDLQSKLPTMFVLMGNFHSRSGSTGNHSAAMTAADMDYVSLRDNFDSLATLIDQYPRIKAESSFVFVPGPGDPGPGSALPQPPLPAYFTGELRRVLPSAVFASNPCRLRYLSQQVVFFRYDILKRMRRRCLIPPNEVNGSAAATQLDGTPAASNTQVTAKAMWGHLALTLLQQSHLCPLPLLLQPIYWQYDHALHLYPLPQAVVIADSSPQAEYTHEGCKVINPGSFSQGLFAAYKPCSQGVEHCEIPLEGANGAYDDEEQEASDRDDDAAAADLDVDMETDQLNTTQDPEHVSASATPLKSPQGKEFVAAGHSADRRQDGAGPRATGSAVDTQGSGEDEDEDARAGKRRDGGDVSDRPMMDQGVCKMLVTNLDVAQESSQMHMEQDVSAADDAGEDV